MTTLHETQYKTLIQKATNKITELQKKVQKLHEPIAIIGMGCRFPKANTLQEYWYMLSNGIDGTSDRPEFHSYIDPYYNPDLNVTDKIYVRKGGFLHQDPAEFDSNFFRIPNLEANSLDPQHRLMLEVTWEALENAGIIPEKLSGTDTGVFMGICSNDYAWRLVKQKTEDIDVYLGSGNAYSPISGRVSYLLDIHGPSLAIDTACSSSLTSTHVAVNSIRSGECKIAIVGGIQRYLSPEYWMNLCKSRMLSPDGTCKSFSEEANGYGRGEGCGVIILKSLTDALQNKDKIYGTIIGTATGQDGKTSGLTVPNGASQQEVIKKAMQNARINQEHIDYIETHGTGTPLGDPIEANALINLFKNKKNTLLIGSVKSNIGHLEGSAGLAGLIKVVLSLYHQKIPQNLHFVTPSTHIKWHQSPIKVNTKLTSWNKTNHKRTAGISSFGFEGVNTHLIIQEFEQPQPITNSPQNHIITLSSKTKIGLKQTIQKYYNFIKLNTPLIEDIAFTTNCKRTHYKERVSIVTQSTQELLDKIKHCTIQNQTNKKIVFLFTGQGTEYFNMAHTLYEHNTHFKKFLNTCNKILLDKKLIPISLIEILYNKKNIQLLKETIYTQLTIFAIEYAISQTLILLGIEPNIVLGHSLGEYTAACISNTMSLEDTLTLIAHRAKIITTLPKNGMMVSILASEEKVKQIIFNTEIAIAAINGPNNTVISGENIQITNALQKFHKLNIPYIKIPIPYGFHSSLMDPILEKFYNINNQIQYNIPEITFISNLTGQQENTIDTQYWCKHMTHTVQFVQSINTINTLNAQIFVEIGPKPVLIQLTKTILKNNHNNIYSHVLDQNQDYLYNILSMLYNQGFDINWNLIHKETRLPIMLPTYCWQRKKHWVEIENH